MLRKKDEKIEKFEREVNKFNLILRIDFEEDSDWKSNQKQLSTLKFSFENWIVIEFGNESVLLYLDIFHFRQKPENLKNKDNISQRKDRFWMSSTNDSDRGCELVQSLRVMSE